jgi:hypothetical protein
LFQAECRGPVAVVLSRLWSASLLPLQKLCRQRRLG